MTDGVDAIRRSVALSRRDGTAVVRVSGDDAWDVVDRLVTSDLHLRDGQLRQSLILDDGGAIVADVLLACDDEDLWLLVEGLDAGAVHDRLLDRAGPGNDVAVEPLDVAVIGFDGPFAWEMLSRWDSPSAVGLPYLSLYRPRPDIACLRAGTTGEYGYLLLVPSPAADRVHAALTEIGADLECAEASRAALSYCALENWFFDIATLGRHRLDPVAAQLQWRVSRHKEFPGSAALDALRAGGVPRRLTAVAGPDLVEGSAVRLDSDTVGEVLVAAPAHGRPGAIGAALIDLPLAHSGIDALTAGDVPIRTLSPPFLLNRSLFVRWQRHTWAGRDAIEYPPGVI